MFYKTSTELRFHQLSDTQKAAIINKCRRIGYPKRERDPLRVVMPFGLGQLDSDSHRTFVKMSLGLFKTLAAMPEQPQEGDEE